MSQNPNHPWHMKTPAPTATAEEKRRYARAVRLSQFAAGRGSRDPAYRQHCLDNWQAYLNGEIEPPTGRKTIERGTQLTRGA